jgi:hypothetical protein
MSRVNSYKERERGEREGSPVPVVELYDTSGAQVCYCHSFLVPCYLFVLFFPLSGSAGDWTTKESVFVGDWTTKESVFVTDWTRDPSLLHSVHTSY